MYISYPLSVQNIDTRYPESFPSYNEEGVWECFKNAIGGFIRDVFFLPLFNRLPPVFAAVMSEEKTVVMDFWQSDHSFPDLPHHAEIKEHFTYAIQTIAFSLREKSLRLTYAMIEYKEPEESNPAHYNFVHVLGQLSKIDSDIYGTYPFLAAYLNHKKLDPTTPSARFILISQYETTTEDGAVYKARSLNELGEILHKGIEGLSTRFNEPIHQVVAHSIGSIVCSVALKYFKAHPPLNILLDRGPSSVLKLSNRYTGGWICIPLAFLTGWLADFGKEIKNLFGDRNNFFTGKKIHSLVISGALNDHRFGGDCNLFLSPEVQELHKEKKLFVLPFTLPLQRSHPYGVHGAGNDSFIYRHLEESYREQSYLSRTETLAQAVIRQSLPSCERRAICALKSP